VSLTDSSSDVGHDLLDIDRLASSAIRLLLLLRAASIGASPVRASPPSMKVPSSRRWALIHWH
jgi:hypothetical protein